MDYQIVHPGSNAMVVVKLEAGESIKAEAGAMVAKSAHVEIEASTMGGVGAALKRSLLGGETFFFQTLKAVGAPGEVMIAPSPPGDIKILDMTNGQDYYLQGGTFLAGLGDITFDTKMQNLVKGLFSGAGLFVVHVTGRGHAVASAFGGVHEISIAAGQDFIVDNGHIVAWTGDMSYKIEKATKGWISTITSGEGFICRFTGPGKVWLQTRNPHAFGQWVRQFVPTSG